MEEFESQTERVEEDLHHHAHGAHAAGERWVSGVALTAALLAALAATAALMSGHYANDAMMESIRASDSWAHYQAKSIKAAMLVNLRDVLDKPLPPARKEKLDEYERDQKELMAQATEEGESAKRHFHQHGTLAISVTLFQVAIAVSAISALTRRRAFWFVGMVLGCAGIFFLGRGLWMA